jgi:hypothetical protein
MLRAGVIEPATSEWASPVVLVPKPDGSMGFCLDYRMFKAVTVRDSYPLPRMDDFIDYLGDASVFSTLECNSATGKSRYGQKTRRRRLLLLTKVSVVL